MPRLVIEPVNTLAAPRLVAMVTARMLSGGSIAVKPWSPSRSLRRTQAVVAIVGSTPTASNSNRALGTGQSGQCGKKQQSVAAAHAALLSRCLDSQRVGGKTECQGLERLAGQGELLTGGRPDVIDGSVTARRDVQ